MRIVVIVALMGTFCAVGGGQGPSATPAVLDSDHDGLADAQEQALLEQFAPRFMISLSDCSAQPAEFQSSMANPVVAAENGTIYGQAFPRATREGQVELHYYDLWRKDCGQQGHDLDAEHVSVVVARDESGTWKAEYWYAAAHEDTLCDASQIATAKALHAEQHGPEVWISAGKHGAFLTQALCKHGCGADDCEGEAPISSREIVNLGEPAMPMNGAIWAGSAGWPLGEKMRRSDFTDERTARLERVGADEIAWASPAKRPVQAAILGGDRGLDGAATGFRATGSALTTADEHSANALDRASSSTGNALVRSYRGVMKFLRGGAGKKKAPKEPTAKVTQP